MRRRGSVVPGPHQAPRAARIPFPARPESHPTGVVVVVSERVPQFLDRFADAGVVMDTGLQQDRRLRVPPGDLVGPSDEVQPLATIGPTSFSTKSSAPRRAGCCRPAAGVRVPAIGRPRYTRQAGSRASGSAAAIACWVRGGSSPGQATTSGARRRLRVGGSAAYGTPAATPTSGTGAEMPV